MAFAHGKDARVLVADKNLTTFFNEVGGASEIEAGETTTFGQGAKTYVIGLEDGTVSLSGLFDGSTGAVDDSLQGALGSESVPFIVYPQGNDGEGSRVLFGDSLETSYEVTSPVADVVSVSAELQGSGGLFRGVALNSPGSGTDLQEVTSGDTSVSNASVDNGASTSGGAIGRVIFYNDTLDGACTVRFQHSSDNAAWSDLFTVSSTDENLSGQVSGTVDQFVRALIEESASSGSVFLGIAFQRL